MKQQKPRLTKRVRAGAEVFRKWKGTVTFEFDDANLTQPAREMADLQRLKDYLQELIEYATFSRDVEEGPSSPPPAGGGDAPTGDDVPQADRS